MCVYTYMHTPLCRVCNVELTEKNWYLSCMKKNSKICKSCDINQTQIWISKNKERYKKNQERNSKRWNKANPEKRRLLSEHSNRKRGRRPMSEAKECSIYLGIYVAERVLKDVFNDVVQMPQNHKGYDFVCNHGKKIDVKSSTLHKDNRWLFRIGTNIIADYFLCLAFDNRKDLNPLHLWLIPGDTLNKYIGVGISKGKIHKWDEYRLNIDKVISCCDIIKGK